MIKPCDIPADITAALASILTARLDDYKAAYRAFVIGQLCKVRDAQKERSPEWTALNDVLLRLGAAPRNPPFE